MTLDDTALTLAKGIAIFITVHLLVRWFQQPKYPPGPRRLPLIGNLLVLPKEDLWVAFTKWKEIHGDIIYTEVLGTSMVVLNSYKTCSDLLEKRSDIYSDRVHTVVLTQLMSWGKAVTISRYGDRWRRYRKICAQGMKKENIEQFHPVQETEIARFLGTLLDSPKNWRVNYRTASGKAILWNFYGYEVESVDDVVVRAAEHAVQAALAALKPGHFLVDLFPKLLHLPEWLPGSGYKEWARQGDAYTRAMTDLPFEHTVNQMKTGIHPPSFTSQNLEKGEDSDTVKWCSGTMFSAGIDTSVATLHCFLVAMTFFPETQRRAQAEIDNVCGTGHLPTMEDRSNLPYVNALVKEVLRWQPVLPLAIPHRVTRDDVYDGYFIAEGSMIMGNTWAISRDPEYFPNPETFDPNRYFNKSSPALNPEAFAFGYGRRICAGLNYADAFLFLSICRILAVFDISRPIDEDGKEVEPEVQFCSRFVREPVDFRCTIKPRSEAARALILSSNQHK